jgi:hypothetical protein
MAKRGQIFTNFNNVMRFLAVVMDFVLLAGIKI